PSPWEPAAALPARPTHPGVRQAAAAANRAEPRGTLREQPAAQADPGRQPDPLEPVQEAALADARADIRAAANAAGQARQRATGADRRAGGPRADAGRGGDRRDRPGGRGEEDRARARWRGGGGAMLARLLSAHEAIITAVRAAIKQSAQNGEGGSNELLIGEVLRTHEQQVWGV